MDPSHSQIDVAVSSLAATAGTDSTDGSLWLLPQSARLDSLWFTPDRAVTADDTNYADISVELDGVEVASEQTTTGDTGDLTAGSAIEMAITGSAAQCEVAAGDAITVKATKAGAGVAIGGTVSARFAFDRAGV